MTLLLPQRGSAPCPGCPRSRSTWWSRWSWRCWAARSQFQIYQLIFRIYDLSSATPSWSPTSSWTCCTSPPRCPYGSALPGTASWSHSSPRSACRWACWSVTLNWGLGRWSFGGSVIGTLVSWLWRNIYYYLDRKTRIPQSQGLWPSHKQASWGTRTPKPCS